MRVFGVLCQQAAAGTSSTRHSIAVTHARHALESHEVRDAVASAPELAAHAQDAGAAAAERVGALARA